MDVGSRRSGRDTSPDLAKICRPQQQQQHHHHNHKLNNKPLQKVQVIYYLSRSGLLEHPHYMELTLFPDQPLRLKDVLDRLVALRGSSMPSLYSWSCKRNYKRGYVWYDLAANDVLYPTEGAEYVLKGSELVEGCSERVQHLHVSKPQPIHQVQDPNLNSKRRSSFHSSPPEVEFQELEEQEEEYEDGEKTSYTSSTTTPHSRCSRGVSTDELVLDEDHETGPQTQAQPKSAQKKEPRIAFEDGLAVAASPNSILLQLIACGSSAVAKAKTTPCVSNVEKKREICVKVSEDEIIKCMSENPRFGNLQSEEKEYFSGSIVESRKEKRVESDEAVLKKSNSYNEERSSNVGIGEEEKEERETKKKGGGKGRCMPRKKLM